ncbi:MAG TPA: serine/threonine protein kinase [Planctomycetaceae bacterium]|nr:serine/threonine protein kinase [Planctomycetaceae bacterium]
MRLSIDDVELGAELGTGTVGQVFRGRLKQSDTPVAVKFLQRAISDDELVRARFEREMSILERLEHPHIIHYYGGGRHDNQLFYAMEIVDRGNVQDLLDKFGSLGWREVASIARQICSALQHAHNHGIIHRDLKPSNIFITSDAVAKLGDFGIARDTHAADITSHGLTVGTHAYMSPEQIRGDASVTGQADLYSLGCVLFEMLAGQRAFPGTNFANLFEQHLFKEPPRIREYCPDLPAAMIEVVDSLLEKDPADRPFNARAVQAVMLRLIDEHAGASDPSSSDDVAAGEVVDPGLVTLKLKLQPPPMHQANWPILAVVGALAMIIIVVAALMGQG